MNLIKRITLWLIAGLSLASGQNYTARRGQSGTVEVVRLSDAAAGVEIVVVPSLGNRVSEMNVHGQNILYFPQPDLAQLQKTPNLSGVPFLAPWANRLDEEAFWANGKRYAFDMALGNVRGPVPIHGLLTNTNAWQVVDVGANGESAHVTSRLEFWKYPDLMAQWPFAHEYEITYRLSKGALEVQTTVTNLSDQVMPLSLGFHPYYRIPGVPREQWTVRIPARKIVVTDTRLVADGSYRENDLPQNFPLASRYLDTGFADLEHDPDGRVRLSIEANGKKIETLFGPKYPVAVVFAPTSLENQPREFICIEPMTGITNAINLHQKGLYPELQKLAPRAKWTESFWIRTSGF